MEPDNAAEHRQGVEELIGLLYADTPLQTIQTRACALARKAIQAECAFLAVALDGERKTVAQACAEDAHGTDPPGGLIARAIDRGDRLFESGALAVPIRYGDRTVGALAATSGRRQFSNYDADVLDVYAQYAAIAQSNYAKVGEWTHTMHGLRRATWIIAAAAVLVTIALAAYGVVSANINARRVSEAARRWADASSDHFERFVAVDAQLASSAAAIAPNFLSERPSTERLLKAMLDSTPSSVVYGMGLWYEPYAFSRNVRLYGPYAHRVMHDGITLTYQWSANTYDYPMHAWYRAGERAGSNTVFTPPYFDVDHVYISAIHRIQVGGKFAGVSSADMTSQSIDTFLRSLASRQHVTYVSRRDGHIVAFPNSDALLAFARRRHPVKRILDVTDADAAAFIAATYSSNRIAMRSPLRPMPLMLVDSWDPAALGAGPAVPVPFLIASALLVWALAGTAIVVLWHARRRTRQALDVDQERCRLLFEIEAHVKAEQALRRAAETDQLTGLSDRSSLLHAIERIIEQRAGNGHASDGLLLLDLNGLEAVNQRSGHTAGDEVLVRAASLVRRCCSATDLAARLGGDEFAVLMRGGARQRAATIAECVQRGMSSGVQVDEHVAFVDISAGFAEIGSDHHSAQDLIRDADYAITHAKRRGGALTDFTPELRADAHRERELQAALRGALARGELRVAYQPIYRLSDRKVTGVEALARWMRDHHVVLPGEFIPVAERSGLVLEVDRYIARTAIRRMRALPDLENLRLSLNVSALHFKSPEAFAALQRTLSDNAAARKIDVELTETAVMTLSGEPDDLVARLHESGVGMHLDDFGTGYSSLAYLQHMPVDALKIDRTFVAAMLDDERARQIVDAIVQLARRLQVDTIVEGIETEEQEIALRELGATMGQGFFYAQPMTADALEQLVMKVPLNQGGEP